MLEGFDWVAVGGFEGRINTKDNADNDGGAEGGEENLPTNVWGKWSND